MTQNIEEALKSLESILGHPVILADLSPEELAAPPAKEKPQVARSQDGAPGTLQDSAVVGATPQADFANSDSESVDEMGTSRDALPFAKLKAQDLAGEDVAFCPWKVVLSYPDCYTGNANRPRVRNFFDDILSYRDWSFFYIRDASDLDKAYLLVPTRQVQHFLGFINKRLRTELTVPKGAPGRNFYLRFPGCGPFRPRYLFLHRALRFEASSSGQTGATTTTTASSGGGGFDLDDPATWPRDDEDMGCEAWEALSTEASGRYRASMTVLHREPSKKSKLSAEERSTKRQEHRAKQIASMFEYLGIENGVVARESDVVFCCVDVEAIEVSPNPISEIGIAILDMSKVKGKAPGFRGIDWWTLIEAHHLRIREYSALTNYRYVHGCPEDFQFGESTLPKKEEACDAVRDILEPYISARRRIVLVGHDLEQDIKYLSTVGFDVNETGRVGTVDSQVLHQAWLKSDSGRGLSTVLDRLRFDYSYLHNAGNDAVHTLRAAVGVAFAITEPEDVPE